MIASLPRGALLVADAAYVSYDLLLQLLGAGVDFLIRCGGNTRLRVEGAKTVDELGRDASVFLWPAARAHGWPLVLRLITLSRGGRRMYLLTSVRDSTVLPRRLANRLYAMRWGPKSTSARSSRRWNVANCWRVPHRSAPWSWSVTSSRWRCFRHTQPCCWGRAWYA